MFFLYLMLWCNYLRQQRAAISNVSGGRRSRGSRGGGWCIRRGGGGVTHTEHWWSKTLTWKINVLFACPPFLYILHFKRFLHNAKLRLSFILHAAQRKETDAKKKIWWIKTKRWSENRKMLTVKSDFKSLFLNWQFHSTSVCLVSFPVSATQ